MGDESYGDFRSVRSMPTLPYSGEYPIEVRYRRWGITICFLLVAITSKTPYVAIDERGLVRSIHLFLFSCVH